MKTVTTATADVPAAISGPQGLLSFQREGSNLRHEEDSSASADQYDNMPSLISGSSEEDYSSSDEESEFFPVHAKPAAVDQYDNMPSLISDSSEEEYGSSDEEDDLYRSEEVQHHSAAALMVRPSFCSSKSDLEIKNVVRRVCTKRSIQRNISALAACVQSTVDNRLNDEIKDIVWHVCIHQAVAQDKEFARRVQGFTGSVNALAECGRLNSWIPEKWYGIVPDVSQSDGLTQPVSGNVCNSIAKGLLNVQCAMLDTGCSPQSVFTVLLECCLTKSRPASATYRGAFGSKRLHSNVTGRLKMKIVDKDTGILTGDTYNLEVETIEGLNQSLISYCQLHSDGFDLHISENEGSLKHRENGMIIPLHFNLTQRAWFVHFTCDTISGECMPLSSAFYDDNEDAFNDDAALGDKSGVKGGNKMTKFEFHVWQGHVGYYEGCTVCESIRKSNRRVHRERDRFVELRPGQLWSADLVTFNYAAKCGSVHFACIRDRTTRYPTGFPLVKKDEFCDKLTVLIDQIRKIFQKHWKKHTIFGECSMDNAGEQSDTNKVFQKAMRDVLGGAVTLLYSDPQRQQSKSQNEIAVKVLELGCKAILVCKNLPIDDWVSCMLDAIWLRQRHPTGSNIRGDGDALRPIEQLTDGEHSRKRCNNDLSHFVGFGTVAKIAMNVRGSSLTNAVRERICYCKGRNGNMPKWYCPTNKQTYMTHDFNAIQLSDGQNYCHFFGLAITAPLARPDNIPLRIKDRKMEDVLFETLTESPADNLETSEAIAPNGLQVFDNLDLIYKSPQDMVGRIVHKHFDDHGICRGSVQSYADGEDMHTEWPWCIQWDDGGTEYFNAEDIYDYSFARKDGISPAKTVSFELPASSTDIGMPSAEDKSAGTAAVNKPLLAKTRFDRLKWHYYMTQDNDTWELVCERLKIDIKYRKAYFQWLKMQGFGHNKVADLPHIYMTNPYGNSKKTQRFSAGIPFPAPEGEDWQRLELEASGQMNRVLLEIVSNDLRFDKVMNRGSYCQRGSRQERIVHKLQKKVTMRNEKTSQDEEEQMIFGSLWGDLGDPGRDKRSINEIANDLDSRSVLATDSESGELTLTVDQSDFPGFLMVSKFTEEECAEALSKSEAWKDLPVPKNFKEVLSRPDASLWKRSIRAEMMTFISLGVMSNGHTASELRDEGITSSPIPLKYVFKVKYTPLGEYIKHKSRLVLVGHPRYCLEGIHYQKSDVYACCPDTSMIRLIMIFALLEGFGNTNFDCKSAYLQALKTEGKSIAMSHPKDFRSYSKNGEELLSILLANLYGHPLAAAAWQKTLYDWILKRFNQDGWKAKISHVDRGIILLTSPPKDSSPNDPVTGENDGSNPIIMIVHSDDVDCYSEFESERSFLAKEFDDRFGIVMGDPRYMLGVLREVTDLPGGHRMLKLSMPEYIDELAESFEEYLPKQAPSAPWKPKTLLGIKQNDYDPSEAEQKKYYDLGYMKLVGSLLWIARMSYDELAFGISQLCSVMSKPSEIAWTAALNMLKWLVENKHCGACYRTDFSETIDGVTFSANDLYCYVDSGHGQFDDGKAQHGHVMVFGGGTVKSVSKKHDVVTAATQYSEYIGQFHAVQNCIAARNLFEELGEIGEKYIQSCTYVLGDNAAALGVGMLKKAPGHFELKYHYQREMVEQKKIKFIKVGTLENTADLMTKAVEIVVFKRLYPKLKGIAAL